MSSRSAVDTAKESRRARATPPAVTRADRERIEQDNRAQLELDLLNGRLVFESRPYEAYLQFSNYCNMSCVMCHNGANPPLRKMAPALLDQIAAQVAPSLSVIVPYGASEPLLVGWRDARDMARRHRIDLRITTNVQFLDRRKFGELEDITETLFLSVDTHIPDLFARIRLRSKPERVFRNLRVAAQLARERGIECIAQVVFMTENAPTLPETIAYLADLGIMSVNVLELVDANGQCGSIDPLTNFSAVYVEAIKQRCIATARQKHVRLMWGVAGYERHDFRRPKAPGHPRKDWHARWLRRMKRHAPGFCTNAATGVQVSCDGEVTPCCFAGDELVLGRLGEQDFDAIWNGPTARDLRRGMLTWDYPSLCGTCRLTERVAAEPHLPFVDEALEQIGAAPETVDATLDVAAPAHMTRTGKPPALTVTKPPEAVERYLLAIAAGGEHDVAVHRLRRRRENARFVELSFPRAAWTRMRANAGYWWAVFAVCGGGQPRILRSRELRCLIRHRALRRVAGSTLRYPDAGPPRVHLGAGKPAGRAVRADANGSDPAPPQIRTDSAGNGTPDSARDAPSGWSHADRRALVRAVGRAVRASVPAGARTVALDDQVDARALDLERLRARGTEYLVVPATAFRWLEHHPELADRLGGRYPLVFEDRRSCLIFALGANPALYGRGWERELRRREEAVARRVEAGRG